ncbi:FAD-dependent monooxygenase [Streptacidiphilus sp. EB129]|jgi:2-polyprenyl-6-methoxyphenol hydroxylase-like FAD-dependent oxidoreductase|uniref:FAD-dependent monooxygenase n=1 Tax=Streptacidiphilus sp. EB129 TaxID=3156262 RepID=UPI0035166D4C
MTADPTVAQADVLVVGAGPTGLLLAGDLAAAGLKVTLLEQRAEESNLTRAFAVHARSLEQLDARDLADELIATGTALGSLQIFGRLTVDLSTLPSRFPFVLITPQSNTERLLERRALAAGVVLVRGARVVGLRQDSEGVELDAEPRGADPVPGTDPAPVRYRARYAVGADGVRSTVRELLGIAFPGQAVVNSVMLADVRLEHAPDELLSVGANEQGFAFVAPFGDGWYRVVAWDRDRQLPDGAPVELAEVRSLAGRVLGDDYGMHDARWLSRFHSDERQAPSYREGRVFLAGDAAHCHSPAGGQGLNTGLQDAANLSWKLAAAVQGWAPPGLLDSYQTERHPVGRRVLRTSGGLIRVALAQTTTTRVLRGAVSALADRLTPLARRGGRAVSGIDVSYAAHAPRGAHPLTGRRIPDLRLATPREHDPARLHEALRGGTFVLVGANPERGAKWAGAGRLTCVVPAGGLGTTVLVRPDGYAAWAAEHPSPEATAMALRSHLGAVPAP